MSTIEKAAAKLAANGKSAIRSMDAPVPEPFVAELNPKPTARMQGRSQGFVSAPERFCDIDLSNLVERGYLRPGDGRSQLAQEMRRIKRPLLLNIEKQHARPDNLPPANLIMVTSALPEEGKTFISINLAISMAAELDRRVLLVDADVAKGDITHQLDVLVQRGLSDLLHENNYLAEDGVLTSNVERLSILPAGGRTDHIDELFASELMDQVLARLAESDPDRVVVFDSPPLLATTEASVLARHMGQTVLVVEANKTPQNAVSEAVALLEGCANVSLLLNKTTMHGGGGYGYGYGYGYGSGRGERRSAAARGAEEAQA